MKTESIEVMGGLDRLATSDEIRAAVELYSGGGNDDAPVDVALLIPYEAGGYVRVTSEELEYATILDEISLWIK